MGRKPQNGHSAKSQAERSAIWYEQNKDHANKRRIDRRIREGTIPTMVAMERYNITREYINHRRAEAQPPLPPIIVDEQLTTARGMILKGGKGDRNAVFVQPVPIFEPAPEPPRFTTPSIAYTRVKLGAKGGRLASDDAPVPSTSKRTTRASAKAKLDANDGDLDAEVPVEEQEERGFNVPKNMTALEQCAEQTHPEKYRAKRKGKYVDVPYAKQTIADNIKGMSRSLNFWAKKMNVEFSMEEDLAAWLDKYAKQMYDTSKTLTYKDFPRQKKDSNVAQQTKKLFTPITGMFRIYCRVFGEWFVENYPTAWEYLRTGGEEAHALQEIAKEEIQEKKEAADWQPIRDKAFAAVKAPPKKNASLAEWQDYLLLLIWAGPGMVPTRDNTGAIKIVDTQRDVPELMDSETEKTKGGIIQPVNDYYVLKQKKIIYRTFKTRSQKGEVEHPIPDAIHKRVLESLKAYPRDYLLILPSSWTKGDKTKHRPYGKRITELLKNGSLGLGVNEARHSYITWWYRQAERSAMQERDLSIRMMNSPDELRGYRFFNKSKKAGDKKKKKKSDK